MNTIEDLTREFILAFDKWIVGKESSERLLIEVLEKRELLRGEESAHPNRSAVYIDFDGYECFYQYTEETHTGNIWWTLHSDGWTAFVDDGIADPLFCTGDIFLPTEKDMEEALKLYREAVEA